MVQHAFPLLHICKRDPGWSRCEVWIRYDDTFGILCSLNCCHGGYGQLWAGVWRSGQSLVRWTTGSLCRCLPKAQPVENWNTQAKGSKGLLSHEDQVTRKRSYIKLIQIFFEYGWMHRYFASVPRAKGLAWVALLCWKWFRDELALKKVCCCKRRCHRMWKPELWVCKRFSTKNRRRFQVAFSLWLPLTNEEAGSWSFTCGASCWLCEWTLEMKHRFLMISELFLVQEENRAALRLHPWWWGSEGWFKGPHRKSSEDFQLAVTAKIWHEFLEFP